MISCAPDLTPEEINRSDLSRTHPWVNEFLERCGDIDTISDLVPFYRRLSDLLSSGEHEFVNQILACIDTARCSDLVLVGLARITFSYRDKLSRWSSYVDTVRIEASNRNMDPRSLIGLV